MLATLVKSRITQSAVCIAFLAGIGLVVNNFPVKIIHNKDVENVTIEHTNNKEL